MTEVTTMRIYVASLSDYNAGTLHGAWLDVSDADTMREEIAAMLRGSKHPNIEVDCPDCDGDAPEGTDPCSTCQGRGKVPSAEEWAIHDYEGFGPYRVSEHEDLETLAALAEGEEEHGAAFLAWAENDPSNLDDPSNFQDAYAGEWDSLTDYVEDYMEQSGAEFKAPEGQWFHPANYVDWDRMAHDLEMSGDVWTAEAEGGGVYVFHNR
jgi:antirestriction protein